jgi:hypothetical protein
MNMQSFWDCYNKTSFGHITLLNENILAVKLIEQKCQRGFEFYKSV